MAQFIVRNLEDDVKARLKRRATHHGRSMEEEVRHILRDAVKEQNQRVVKLGSRIAARFAKTGSLFVTRTTLRAQSADYNLPTRDRTVSIGISMIRSPSGERIKPWRS